jgi:hypothetical protein
VLLELAVIPCCVEGIAGAAEAAKEMPITAAAAISVSRIFIKCLPDIVDKA